MHERDAANQLDRAQVGPPPLRDEDGEVAVHETVLNEFGATLVRDDSGLEAPKPKFKRLEAAEKVGPLRLRPQVRLDGRKVLDQETADVWVHCEGLPHVVERDEPLLAPPPPRNHPGDIVLSKFVPFLIVI
ncbi:hypothetical protein PG985_003553 [Apiospora marii]|uniref:Uncharacterized protein n=1 Tax=Apiospora marii TaxID=335849 RepID=A0ABR1SHS9_9PEZI